MPIYTLDLAIPANTPEAAPVTKKITVEGAILNTISILIPDGHVALARMAMFYGIKQIFPYEAGTWLRGNAESVSFRLNWLLPEPRTILTFKGWNEDDTYQHTFYIRVQVSPEYRPLPVELLTRVLHMVERFMHRLIGLP